MNSVSSNRLQWILSGALGASLTFAPALVAQTQQPATAGQQVPTPGQQGDWGAAGPPPDVQNGQIPAQAPQEGPAQNADQTADQNSDQGPPQYPGQATDQTAGQTPAQPPAQAQMPSQGVGYGQAPRPAYQPQGQNRPYANQGAYQGQPAPPSGPVTLNAGMLLSIRTSEPLDSKRAKPGDYFQGTLAQGVYIGNVLAIPRGAQVTGRIVDVKKAGELKGGAGMALQLTNLNLGGNSYALATDVFTTSSPGKGGYTAGNTVGAAALGAVIGAVAGGGPGAAIGAVAGTGVGLGASAATSGPRSVLPPEAMLTFHLTAPATVQPVSYQEAAELSQNSAPPQRRYAQAPYGYAPPPPGYAPYPYAYGYGYPYAYAYGYPYYYRRWR